jgi:hypothetical protein
LALTAKRQEFDDKGKGYNCEENNSIIYLIGIAKG